MHRLRRGVTNLESCLNLMHLQADHSPNYDICHDIWHEFRHAQIHPHIIKNANKTQYGKMEIGYIIIVLNLDY